MFTIYADSQLIYEPGDRELLVLQPKLTLEMGAAGSLDFRVPPTHPFYSQFQQLTTIITANLDGTELFRGRVLSNSRDFNNFRQTYCEGCLSYLVDSVQRGEAFTGSAHTLFNKIINDHNRLVNEEKRFVVGNITVENKEVKIVGKSTGDQEEDPDAYTADVARQIYLDSAVDNWSTTLDYINQSLIDYLGGYLMVRRVGTTNYLDWVKEYSSTATQEIEFGVNLLDMKEEISADELFTVLIPIGDDNLTIASVNNGSNELVDSEGVRKYGRIVKTQTFSNVNSPYTLLQNGQDYLANESNVPITFTIKAVDLSMIDSAVAAIRLGDRVKIKSEPHNINQYYTCTKIEYDLSDPGNTVFTFGNPHQTLTRRYRRDKREETKTEKENISKGTATSSDMLSFHLVGELNDLKEEITDPKKGDTKKKLDEFFDAWIDVKKEQGQVKLGAVYKKLEDTVTVLEQNVGIDFSSPDGTIHIFSVATDAASALTKTAEITTWAGMDEYDNLSSKIQVEADVATIKANIINLQGTIQSLTAEIASVRTSIYGKNVFAGNFYIDDGTEASPYNLKNHTHSFKEGTDGKIIILGADWTGAQHSFKIADTNYYKNGVSARTPKSVQFEKDDNGDTIWNQVSVQTNNDGSFGPFTLNPNPYTSGYNAGYRAGTPTGVGYEVTDEGSYDYSKVYVTVRNGTPLSFSISPNAWTQGYNAGYNAGYRAGESSGSVTISMSQSDEHTGPYGSKYRTVWAVAYQNEAQVASASWNVYYIQ